MVVEPPLSALAAECPLAALGHLLCCGEVGPPGRHGLVCGSLSRSPLLAPGSSSLLEVEVPEPGPNGVDLLLHLSNSLRFRGWDVVHGHEGGRGVLGSDCCLDLRCGREKLLLVIETL